MTAAARLHVPLRALGALLGSTLVLAAATPVDAAELVTSDPISGAEVAEVREVVLVFDGPVDLPADGVRLLTPDGGSTIAGPAEPGPDGSVRIPVADAAPGLNVIAFSGTDTATGDPVSGAVAIAVGGPVGRLDVGRATSAASGGELARALVGAGLGAAAVALLAMLLRARRSRTGGRPEPTVPLAPIAVGAAAVALLGGAIGVWMAVRGASASSADGPFALLASSAFGLWAAGSAVVALLVIALSGRVGVDMRGAMLGAALVVAAVAAAAGTASAALPSAPGDPVELRTSLDNGGQASLSLAPAAVGANTAAVVVGGLPEDGAGDPIAPVLALRPLDGRIGTLRFALEERPGGVLASDRILLPLPGRWRAQLEGIPGIAEDDPAVFDFDVQPNPGGTSGSGS